MDLSQIYNTVYRVIYGNKYLEALLVLVVFFLVAKCIIFISRKVLLKLSSKTKTEIDDLIIKRINKPLSFIVLLIGIRMASVILELSAKVEKVIYEIDTSLIIVVITYIVIVVIDIFIDNWGKHWAEKTKSRIDDQLLNIIHRFSKFFFYIIAFLFILDVWSIEIGPLLASLGIAGIAVAFALQNTLGNIFGGISLIIGKVIKVGDIIELDKDTKGRVLDVGLRSTRIRTFDNEVIIIPNGQLASSKIQNYVPPDPSVRVVIPFGVAYGSDVDKVKKIVINEIKKVEGFKDDHEPKVMFLEMGDSSLNFKAYFYVDSYTKRFSAKDQANTFIYKALNKNKISIPFPQMDVHLKKK